MKNIATIALTILLAGILFVSCGDAPTPPQPSSDTPVTGVSLDKKHIDLGVGATQTLTATVAPADATDKSVKWSSSDTTVATVDKTGKVTAVGKGKATITATTVDGNKTATCEVITDPTLIPLTLEFKENGYFCFEGMSVAGISYSKDDGITKIPVNNGTNIPVEANEKIRLYGNHSAITFRIVCNSVEVYVYGNVMSLYEENGFETSTVIENPSAFFGLFSNNTNIKNHESLDIVLPATTLANNCYASMFFGCTGLTRAPVLPAEQLVSNCYRDMFNGCTNLNSITCLATDIEEGKTLANCVDGWLDGITTFVGTLNVPTESIGGYNWDDVIPDSWLVVTPTSQQEI